VVPPLRERREDIPLLAQQFLSQFAPANRSPITSIAPAAMKALYEYSWPGNVRELRLVMERLAVSTRQSVAQVDDLPTRIRVLRAGPRPAPTSGRLGEAQR